MEQEMRLLDNYEEFHEFLEVNDEPVVIEQPEIVERFLLTSREYLELD